jgi:hypothetical protein
MQAFPVKQPQKSKTATRPVRPASSECPICQNCFHRGLLDVKGESPHSNLLHHAPVNVEALAEIKFHGFDEHGGFNSLAAHDKFLKRYAGTN